MTFKFRNTAFGLTTAALFGMACASVLAASPAPIATIRGEVRSFSPDGRHAAALNRTTVALYDTTNWKLLGEIAIEQYQWVNALLVDNNMRMAAIYETSERRMEIWEFKDRLTSLGSSKIGKDRSIELDQGELSIKGISQALTGRRTFYDDRRKGILHDGDIYDLLSYRCPVTQYLRVSAQLAEVMRSEQISILRQTCDAYPMAESKGGAAEFETYQSDYAVSRKINRWGYTGHPAHGPGDFVLRDGKSEIEAIAKGIDYVTKGRDTLSAVEKISTSGYELISGQPWQVKMKSGTVPAFELTQLGIPGYVPKRVSPNGMLVAFSNGETTKIYAADVVTDRYSNMDPGMLQDLLMEKITNALKEKRSAEALPYFDRLSKTGKPLPESFYYYQLEALEAGGRKTELREYAEAYLKKFGKRGKYYTNVISLLARL
jgi:hypothetical protein